MHQSLATLDNPEFINLQPMDINPLMSQCEIKVLYVGRNRNGSFISKDVANEMAKTLRGAPIVGYYKEEKEDFRDHGHEVIIDDEGIKFNCKTIPYGFVSPDAQVWFQKFTEKTDFGEEIEREYLMTTGYLWTGQYAECANAVQGEGKNQSMELDESTIDGQWSYDEKSNMEFFIINDAIFSKLCILGDDVEPCFEGARVTAPQVSSSFSLDKDFKNTLFDMMQQLNFALKGGTNKMEDEVKTEVAEPVEESVAETVESTEESAVEVAEEPAAETAEEPSDFVKEDDKDDDSNDDNDNDESDDVNDSDDEKDDKKKTYSLEEVSELQTSVDDLKSELNNMTQKYELLEKEYNTLIKEKKQEMIDKFSMLSEEDKKDVVENIDSYSLDEIEAKLSIIFARNQVKNDVSHEDKNDNISKDAIVFSVEPDNTPEWIKAIKENREIQ